MERRKRAPQAGNVDQDRSSRPLEHGACVVCGTQDARLLVMAELCGGAAVTLCGSHALMQSRSHEQFKTATELRAALGERRSVERRAQGDGDELAEKLTAAFTRDRRSGERRAV